MTMTMRRILSKISPQRFESERIQYLKSLGVNFHEDDKSNFLPATKLKNWDVRFTFEEKKKISAK